MRSPSVPLPSAAFSTCLTAWRFYAQGEPVESCIGLGLSGVAFAVAAALPHPRKDRLGGWARVMLTAVLVLSAGQYAYNSYKGNPSTLMARHGIWLHALVSLLVAFLSKGYAADMLPFWLRVVVAEVFVMCKTYAVQGALQTGFSWECLVLQHIAGLILPLAMYPPERASGERATAHSPVPDPDPRSTGQLAKPGPQAAGAGSAAQLAQRAGATRPCSPRARKSTPGPASSRELANPNTKAPLTPYQSVLGDRVTISIKVATRHQPEDLAPTALNNLARLVERFDMQDGRPLADMALGAAVRRGCVLISLTACNGQGRDSMTEAEALMHGQQLLPGLLAQLFPDCSQAGTGAGPASPCLEPGQYLQLQVGSHVVRASLHKDTHEWVFEVQPPVAAPSQPNSTLQLCLADAQPLQLVAADTGTGKTGVHAVPLTVHVRGGDIAFVRGSDPASSPAHDTNKPTPQLWVHCQGQYVQTVVHDVDSYTGTVQATAYVPSAALARHHQPDGPVARLQVLSLELWQGADTVLSRTSLLVDTAQHMQADMPSSFGWWGALAAQAAGLVADVRSLTAAAAAPGSDAAAASHQAFVSDLAVWLQAVQQAAPGTCCDMCAPAATRTLTPTLTPTQPTALASSLQRYALEAGMRNAAACIRTQTHATQAAGVRSSLVSHTMHVCRSVWSRHQCHACSQLYYARMRAMLGRTHVLVSLIHMIAAAVAATQVSTGTHSWVLIVSAVAAVLQCSVRVEGQATAQAHPPTPQARGPSRAREWLLCKGGVELLCMCAQVCIEILIFLNMVPLSMGECRLNTLAPYVLCHSLFNTLGLYVALWGRTPVWATRALMIAESVAHLHKVRTCPGLPRWLSLYWFVSAPIVVPVVTECYLRRLLRPKEPVASGKPMHS